MSILVDDKRIEVRLRYVDKQYIGGAVGAIAFLTSEDEERWVEKENSRRENKAIELKVLDKKVPEKLTKNAKEEVKEIVTFWKRMDWGTQAKILEESRTKNSNGEIETDWPKYRMSQMKNLMVGWDLTSKGEPIPIAEAVLKRMEFDIAIALLNKYEKITSSDLDEDDFENLD